MLTSPVLGVPPAVFTQTEGWDEAVGALQTFVDDRRQEARERADDFRAAYRGARASMVFDVIHSANRNYTTVRSRLDTFRSSPGAASLEALAEHGVEDTTGFRRFEHDSMRTLGQRLAAFGQAHGLSDDAACQRWAECAAPANVFGLDPTIGRIKGIATTQYAYLRMRCGADDVKPDRRVASALWKLGFAVGSAPAHVHAVAHAAAKAVDISPLELDQLLWAGP